MKEVYKIVAVEMLESENGTIPGRELVMEQDFDTYEEAHAARLAADKTITLNTDEEIKFMYEIRFYIIPE